MATEPQALMGEQVRQNNNGERPAGHACCGEAPCYHSNYPDEYVPSEEEKREIARIDRETQRRILKNHQVHITFHDLGCSVEVGCQSFGFSKTDDMLEALSEYIKTPALARDKWMNK